MKTKIVLFADDVPRINYKDELVSDYDNQVETFKAMFKGKNFYHTSNPSDMENIIIGADTVFLDYGGMSKGSTSSIDAVERLFNRLVEEHPNINFVILCVFSRDWYHGYEQPNVTFVEMQNIFDYVKENFIVEEDDIMEAMKIWGSN